MSDITHIDTTEPDELADELEAFSAKYARRTGDYCMATTLNAAAAWLRHFDEVTV